MLHICLTTNLGQLWASILAVPVVVATALGPVPQSAPTHPETPHRHTEAQSLANPLPNTAEVAKQGAAVYAARCAGCHGLYGLGNGRLAAGMAAYGARPSNLTDDVWQHGETDGELFVVIRDGAGPGSQMPDYGGKLSDEEIWQIVRHLRSLSMK